MAAPPWDLVIITISRQDLFRAPKSLNLCLLNTPEEEESETTSVSATRLALFRRWICVTPNTWLRPYISLNEDPTYLPRVLLRMPRWSPASGLFAQAHTDEIYSTLRKSYASLLSRMRFSSHGILDMIANNVIPGRMRRSLCVGGRDGCRRALSRSRQARRTSQAGQQEETQQNQLRSRRADHLMLMRRRAGVISHSAPRQPSVRPRRCG